MKLVDSGITIEDPANHWDYIIVHIDNKGGRKILTCVVGISRAISVRKALYSESCGWTNLKIECF